ncbi:hypothetical protein SODALDRAFT_357079 [Sodiomyces alkalinus F11]|uniref:Pyridoxamine 5'-phosphate oxidase N-terminal domain-containing protein n=1 Tax=Sodiomyces alkalinus (strain CBS 110278 / VKM F-3762 / F11) TaxID=1314773 RepID=A0A3N2Q2Q8_SODAK|nr:hypothetical protein SODALDRAFT_357079 [Sodiomyces alkalinus F11]ROT41054.1 hypothetical protein SODALDRAFT_357079 [Sodiomyces alkalinus F11]
MDPVAVPLNSEASAGDTHKQTTATLPAEVVQCLENARFLHLATCTGNVPNLSLMNYTYLPSSPFSSAPVIVMTTNPASKKMNNLLSNPNVSLLVHDCTCPSSACLSLLCASSTTANMRVSHRPPTTARRPSGGSPTRDPHRSSLAALLLNLNTSAVSSISATINGTARLLDHASEEERFYRAQHLENNTFDNEGVSFGFPPPEPAADAGADAPPTPSVQAEDGGRGCFVAGEDVRVIVVSISDVRISDWKGGVRDYVLADEGAPGAAMNGVQ